MWLQGEFVDLDFSKLNKAEKDDLALRLREHCCRMLNYKDNTHYDVIMDDNGAVQIFESMCLEKPKPKTTKKG